MPQPRRPLGRTHAVRQESLREHNLALALQQVLDAPLPVSRADIAATTGLTRATVSALVNRLLKSGLIRELEPVAAQRAGRPAVPLVPTRGTIAAVGMEVNVDYIGVRAVDLGGGVLRQSIESGDFRGSVPADVLGRLASLAEALLSALSDDGVAVVGTALALPGLVDSVTGPLRIAPNLRWRDVDVVRILAGSPALERMPPRLANEAKLAARAEARVRRGRPSSFVYVSGEVGIGCAVVIDGTIFAGRHGWSGEIGHTVLGVTGPLDEGGTLESYAGQDAILDRAGLPRSTPIAEVAAAACRGDVQVLASLEVAGAALGIALANTVNIVDVEHVVLGGVYADVIAYIGTPVLAALQTRVITAPWADVDISAALAGSYPAMTGAALEVLKVLVEDPGIWTRG